MREYLSDSRGEENIKTDFYQKVAAICRRIPRGKVATYGQIAYLCGKPRNARQVGYALSCRIVEEVPAHRVVNSQGRLSGAAAFETPWTQRQRLEAEGVVMKEDGRIDLSIFGWRPSVEEMADLLSCVP